MTQNLIICFLPNISKTLNFKMLKCERDKIMAANAQLSRKTAYLINENSDLKDRVKYYYSQNA